MQKSKIPGSPLPIRRVLRFLAVGMGALLALGSLVGVGFVGYQNPSAIAELPVLEEDETLPVVALAGRTVPEIPRVAEGFPTCSLSELASDPRLGSFAGIVVDPWSGEKFFEREAGEGLAPASVLKTITAAAALTALGPEQTFVTEVRQGTESDTLFLVAGGDPTLRAKRSETESVYIGAASMTDLAEQTIAALSAQTEGGDSAITELVVDATLWGLEDTWDETWADSARSRGFLSRVSPLQVDGDRRDPGVAMSPRGNDPARRAAEAFVSELRQAGNTARFVSIRYASADAEASVLATVESRPVRELVTYMLKESDNTLAEVLARHVSLAVGLGGAQSTVGEALTQVLSPYGIDAEGVFIRDGSGLSAANQVTPDYVAQVLLEVMRNDGSLGELREALPIAGVDGSLDDRFSGENIVVTARVQAKTGSITGTRALAGFIQGEDDTDFVFAFFATGEVGDDARTALETVVAGVYSCGANLADF